MEKNWKEDKKNVNSEICEKIFPKESFINYSGNIVKNYYREKKMRMELYMKAFYVNIANFVSFVIKS